jgi:ADP-ribosylglycohydrolase
MPGGAFLKQSVLMQHKELMWPRAPGMTCLGALRSGNMGTMDDPINTSKGCGGVMRVAPCGLLKMTDMPDPEDAYAMQGAMAAAITHSHLMGYVPAAMLADVVHQIVQGDGRSLEEIIRSSLTRTMRLFAPEIADAQGCEGCGAEEKGVMSGSFRMMLEFREMIMKAVKLAGTDVPAVEAIRQLGEGWVGDEALAIAVYCVLRYQDDMEECLSAAVTHSGDSDSTGAIAGNILGAWLGVEGIPQEWLEAVELRDVIDDMACALYDAQIN